VVVSLTTLPVAAASPLCNIVISSVLHPCRSRQATWSVRLHRLAVRADHLALPSTAEGEPRPRPKPDMAN
jgi:hypothetical protein